MADSETVILDQAGVNRALTRISHEILERNKGTARSRSGRHSHRRGSPGRATAQPIAEIEGEEIPLGSGGYHHVP